MSKKTIIARIIPVAKQLAGDLGKAHDNERSAALKITNLRRLSFLKANTSGAVSKAWLNKAYLEQDYNSVSARRGDVTVSVQLDDKERLPKQVFCSSTKCTMASEIFGLVGSTPALKKVEAYMVALIGSKDDVLALSDSLFKAHLRRFLMDRHAPHTCDA